MHKPYIGRRLGWVPLGLGLLAAGLNPSVWGLTFFAMGDAPYHRGAQLQMAELLDRATREGAQFLIHVGDIKSGSSRCGDDAYLAVQRMFARQSLPVVYTPGDNEWTDCRRTKAGGYDPEERLAHLRRVFFDDGRTLRLDQLAARYAFEQPETAYPELYWFIAEGTLFVALHAVGSYDNYRPTIAGAVDEHRARQQANRRLLDRALQQAAAHPVKAAVILLHANPGFERDEPHPGFRPLIAALKAFALQLARPVLLIHGDTHRLKIDRPFSKLTGLEKVQRLEVQGHPLVGGVMIEIDHRRPEPFRFDPIPAALESWESD
jgi:hypothetical protein